MYQFCIDREFQQGSRNAALNHFSIIENNLVGEEEVEFAFMGLHNFVSFGSNDGEHAYAVTGSRIMIARKDIIGDAFHAIDLPLLNGVSAGMGPLSGAIIFDCDEVVFNAWTPKKVTNVIMEGINRAASLTARHDGAEGGKDIHPNPHEFADDPLNDFIPRGIYEEKDKKFYDIPAASMVRVSGGNFESVAAAPVKKWKNWPMFAGMTLIMFFVAISAAPRPESEASVTLALEVEEFARDSAETQTLEAIPLQAPVPVTAVSRSGGANDGHKNITPDDLYDAVIGDTIEVEPGLYLTVNGVRTASDGLVSADGLYVIFDCTYENRTRGEFALSTLINLSVKDTDGYKYNAALWAETKGSLDGSLPAGDMVRGEVAFDIPDGSSVKYFCYDPFLVFGYCQARWTIV